jgi:hypothetical protein
MSHRSSLALPKIAFNLPQKLREIPATLRTKKNARNGYSLIKTAFLLFEGSISQKFVTLSSAKKPMWVDLRR